MILSKNFVFRNLRMCEVLGNEIVKRNFCMMWRCIARFKKYGRTTEIILSTIIVHQQEAIIPCTCTSAGTESEEKL